jgi:hypothetical protein
MFTVDAKRDFVLLFLSRTAKLSIYFVDVNLTHSFSQKTGMARHAI